MKRFLKVCNSSHPILLISVTIRVVKYHAGANQVDCWTGGTLNLKTQTPGQASTGVGTRREQPVGTAPRLTGHTSKQGGAALPCGRGNKKQC